MSWREVAALLGKLLLLFCLALLPSIVMAIHYREWGAFVALCETAAIGGACGLVPLLLGRKATGNDLFRRETLLVVAASWIIAAAIGALAFQLSGMSPSFTDEFFGSMSGIATTGSTILTDIEAPPKSLLFWRQTLHFVGALGIVVLFVAILGGQGGGSSGKSLSRAEVPGLFKEADRPRIRDSALGVAKVYLGLNIVLAVLLVAAGMPLLDAIANAMATIATGGISPNGKSSYGYGNPAAEWIIIVFMLLAGTNFALHLGLLRGKVLCHKDMEFLGYLGVTVGGALVAALLMWSFGVGAPADPAEIPYVSDAGGFNIRDTLFMVFSIGTSTGFGSVDYDGWPEGVKLFLLLLMVSGVCAGSTSGGLRLIRWMVVSRYLPQLVGRQARPREVRQLKLGKRPITPEQVDEIVLVDLPPQDLLQRLREGKVYVGAQATLAREGEQRTVTLHRLNRRLAAVRGVQPII